MQLSPNYARSEFEKDGPMPVEAVISYTTLCTNVLEPIRKNFQPIGNGVRKMPITSGFRSDAANKAANGVPNSEHKATSDWCAADFEMEGMEQDMRPVFDWVRMSQLPFHQVTLEHGASGDVIHISWNRTAMARQALEGATHNATPYKAWPVAPTLMSRSA